MAMGAPPEPDPAAPTAPVPAPPAPLAPPGPAAFEPAADPVPAAPPAAAAALAAPASPPGPVAPDASSTPAPRDAARRPPWPADPSTTTTCPSARRLVAPPTDTAAGMPNSLATTAACDIRPPTSVTTAAAQAKRGV